MTYATAIAARRAFTLPGYPTLAGEGFDGDYVSPIQMTSGNLDGPMFISKDWLDAPSVRQHRAELQRQGYLNNNPYNRVMDLVLKLLNLTRADIYITPVFHLLTAQRSSTIPPAHARASFDAVGRHELLGRRPVAMGHDAARVLRHFDVPHVQAPHPSARIGTYQDKAEQIAQAAKVAA